MRQSETSVKVGGPTNADLFYDCYLPLVGVLRSQWESSGKITTISYGSAVLLASRVILTCTHNIYSEKLGRVCDSAYFIPGVNGDCILDRPHYKITKGKSFKFKKATQTFRFKPITEELSLVLLDQPYQDTQPAIYPKIGSNQLLLGQALTIAAYSSRFYYSKVSMADVYPHISVLTGTLHSLKEHAINHTMTTSIGMSGAPIFAKNQANQYFICGIHTHRGQEEGYNSGLYFNSEVVKKLRDFFDELKRENGIEDTLNMLEMDDRVGMDTMDTEDEFYDESFEKNSNISCFDDLLERDDDIILDNRNSLQGQSQTISQDS